MSDSDKNVDKFTRDIKNEIENVLIEQEVKVKSRRDSFHDEYCGTAAPGMQKLNNQVPQGSKNVNESEFNLLKDEESMIPKGLLDLACDKTEGRDPIPADNSTSSGIQQGIPCFIALFPAGNPNDWYPPQFNNFNGSYTYPPPPIPPTPIGSYMRSQGNEYYRNVRSVGTSNSRSQQSLDYAWWNSMRACPNFYNPYPNIEMKTYNCQRNVNPLFGYDAYQQLSFNRYPIEIPSGNANLNPNMVYGLDSGYVGQDSYPIPYSKTFYKPNSRIGKESQTENTTNVIILKESEENVNSGCETIAHSSDDSSLSQSKECPFQDHGNSLNDSSSLPEDNCERDSFQDTALYSCLQLEQILNTTKVESELDLKECCVRMKSELSKCKQFVSAEAMFKEMIFSLFHVCNAWTSFTSIKESSKDLIRCYSFEPLIESFENWESKSKTLLENLMSSIQCESRQNIHKELISSDFKLIESNDAKIDKAEDAIGKNIKEYLPNNLNSNSSDQSKIHEVHEPNNVIGQLSPESHRSEKSYKPDSIFDNIMKELKKNQDESVKMRCDKNAFPCQLMKKKQSSTSPSNEEPALKLEVNRNVKSLNQCDVSNNSLMRNIGHLRSKRDRNSRNTSLGQNPIGEDIKGCQNIRFGPLDDKDPKSRLKLDKSALVISETNKIPIKTDWAFDKYEVGGKTKENDIPTSQSKVNELGNCRRYSTRQRRKNRSVNSLKTNDQCGKGCFDFNDSISVNTKLKLYDIILGIESVDLKPLISKKVTDADISKIRQSIINPLMNIGHSLSRNVYKNINGVLDDVYALFYRAKRENKGNIVVLTAVNRLELRLMNIMFEEIGTC